MLNKSKGNMYSFVTHTWNPIKGKCPHGCSYCYMHQDLLNPVRLEKKEFTDNGKDNIIFAGSSCDMWADEIPDHWIHDVLIHCKAYYSNRYLFQSKNPKRFNEFDEYLPYDLILGTTIESNRHYPEIYKKSPPVEERAREIEKAARRGHTVMVTIEPILDFDVDQMVAMVENMLPAWVNIGADSKGHKLPEPPEGKINDLIMGINAFTHVNIKKNLRRLSSLIEIDEAVGM